MCQKHTTVNNSQNLFQWTISYIPKKTGEERNVGDIKLVHCGTRCVRRTYDATLIKVSEDNFLSLFQLFQGEGDS